MTTVLDFPTIRGAPITSRDEQPPVMDSLEVLQRGVYQARWKIDGCPVLYAVKSNGDRASSVIVLRQGVSAADAWHRLRRRLDRDDPVGPRLDG